MTGVTLRYDHEWAGLLEKVPADELMRLMGAIYGLTHAPRIFWLDADKKLQSLGGQPHALERCIWVFVSSNKKDINAVEYAVCSEITRHEQSGVVSRNFKEIGQRERCNDPMKSRSGVERAG